MRKHHKVLMIFITILVCISFSWYWNKNTDIGQLGSTTAGKFYDRNVPQSEIQRNSRLLRLASQLGMRELVTELTTGAQTETEAYNSFSWNLMVLRYESEQLGIKATTDEVAGAVKALPAFQGENGFDMARYTDLTDRALAPNGFSETQIEELAGDQVALQELKKILRAGVTIPETEMRSEYEQAFSKMDVSVVRLPSPDAAKEAQASDDEISKAFEAQKAQLKSDEKRSVQFVQFALNEEQKKLTGKSRVDVLQKLADQANDFTDALAVKGANFEQVAAKFKITPKVTGEFAQSAPDQQLAGTPQLASTAFALSQDSPNSEAIQTSDGFDILHLMKITPSHPLTLEEARPKLAEELNAQKAQQAAAAKGAEIAGKLRTALASGKSPADAATEAGVQAKKLPAFSLADEAPDAAPGATPAPKTESPDMPYIKRAASDLSPGSVSDYVRTPDGGLLVILDKREKVDPAQYVKALPSLEERALAGKERLVFYEWLRERRHAAGIEDPKTPAATG